MYFGANTFLFIIVTIILTYTIAGVSEIFRLNYRLSIFIMVCSVIGLGFLYQYLYFLKINSIPANGENYRIKEAFLNYTFHDDASADVGHKLLFEANKNSGLKNSLSYIFYETDEISSLEVLFNNNSMNPSALNIPNTYELKTGINKNILTLHLPYSNSKHINVSINYSVKNALKEHNGALIYYNAFFPERTNFSFNTNVKGKITFSYPESSIISFGANSKDFWVNTSDSYRDSFEVEFKNKLPYEENLFSRFSDWIKLYDPAAYDKSYIKDFSLITRLDFSAAGFKEAYHPLTTDLSTRAYSVSELKSLNTENNKKFSDFKFMLDVLVTSWFHGNSLFLFISFPFIYSYYEQQKGTVAK